MGILAECPICHRKRGVTKKRCPCGADLDKLKKAKKVRYHIDYQSNGKQKRVSVASVKGMDPFSIEDAHKLKARYIVAKEENRLEIFDRKTENLITFNALSKWYLGLEKVKALASYDTVTVYLNKFNREYGHKKVSDIKPADLENLQAKRIKQGLKPKTVDDEINYVKSMVIKGFDNDKIGGDVLKTFRRVKKLLKGHANRRDRALTQEEFNRLVEASPKHLKDILTMGYWTGMRKGEITSLTWGKVGMVNRMIRLEAGDTKEGQPKSVPMAQAVHDVLSGITRGLPHVNVFMYYRKPITRNFSQGLKSACAKANILWGRDVKGGFTFHDLRHTFITDMRRAGVDRTVTMAITGHAIRDMNERYDVVEDSDKITAIRRLAAYRLKNDQNPDKADLTFA